MITETQKELLGPHRAESWPEAPPPPLPSGEEVGQEMPAGSTEGVSVCLSPKLGKSPLHIRNLGLPSRRFGVSNKEGYRP